ncbi:uncharacterized protein ASCRUDRAFT_70241 [Ascoidea rubescens DSM 1968]|uniref:Uncharacterized protein n=1 Tax=Ascoidea rubescens DSM 1968 TaxID=1344418 RepID=A0A1D2VH74_9ASCO|nr:hypothetical protein ASCRUDRAFT_70241 [Ascoidea rubescens DSM 1968]ODV61004.1 hypothetical protein ASCRUDRAFT_70241 [Ascoidea rubescens DSM 1968]
MRSTVQIHYVLVYNDQLSIERAYNVQSQTSLIFYFYVGSLRIFFKDGHIGHNDIDEIVMIRHQFGTDAVETGAERSLLQSLLTMKRTNGGDTSGFISKELTAATSKNATTIAVEGTA